MELPSSLRMLLSILLTVGILGASMIGLLQTHAYSSSLLPRTLLVQFLEFICPILSIAGYISPVTSVVSMVRNSDVKDFPAQVVFAQMVQNVAALSYGIIRDNQPFLVSALIGIGFQVLWLTVWYAIGRRRAKIRLWRQTNPFVIVLVGIVLIGIITKSLTYLGPDIVGWVCCILTLVLCVAPLASLGVVIRTKDCASIPVTMTTVMMIANIAWTMYGIVLEDSYVYLPSLFGFVVTVFQLIVTAWCSGVLFYELAFLQWLFGGIEVVRNVSSVSNATVFPPSPEEENE